MAAHQAEEQQMERLWAVYSVESLSVLRLLGK